MSGLNEMIVEEKFSQFVSLCKGKPSKVRKKKKKVLALKSIFSFFSSRQSDNSTLSFSSLISAVGDNDNAFLSMNNV